VYYNTRFKYAKSKITAQRSLYLDRIIIINPLSL